MGSNLKWQLWVIAGLGLALAGCNDQITEEEAQQGFQATHTALLAGQAQAIGQGSGDVSFSATCLGGGSMSFDGTWQGADDQNFNWTVAFDQCDSQGVTIDGSITYDLNVVTDNTGTTLTYGWNGALEWSGDVEGRCDIDVNGRIAAGQTGASVEHTGSVCGHDASATLNVGF